MTGASTQMAGDEGTKASASALELRLAAILRKRQNINLKRSIDTPAPRSLVDFSSNDYLGLARNPVLSSLFLESLRSHSSPGCRSSNTSQDAPMMGSTGSRLLTGNSSDALDLEHYLACFHGSKDEKALLFNSGYDANVSLFSCLPQPGSTIIYDSLIHASVHDGMRRSRAAVVKAFKHNDLADLASVVWAEVERIERDVAAASVHRSGSDAGSGILVAVESIYSMDGDEAPLVGIVGLIESVGARAGGAYLIVDEAHSTGVRGPQGKGMTVGLGLQDRIFARLHTFGKGVGAHGAVVVGPRVLREYLVNYARPLIYSTSLPLHSLKAIQCSYSFLEQQAEELQLQLDSLIKFFHHTFKGALLPAGCYLLPSNSPIQGIVVPGNAQVSAVAKLLISRGLDCRPIRSPTVPKGTERLRVCLHAHNTREDILLLAKEVKSVLEAGGQERLLSKI
ncbi:hypothetical protein HK101_008233 [Irineochytrium annulatum]|nr:hypothetical protein HK101_008233 [Irineochytrium annulatum]